MLHTKQNMVGVSGSVGIQLLRGAQTRARALELDAPAIRAPWTWRLRNLPYLLSGMWRVALAHVFSAITGFPVAYGALYLRKFDGALGVWVDYGLVGMKVVTTTGVEFIVDAFQNSVELENMKFHGFGTGTNAEAAGNTALQTELTTEYATDNTRPTGSTTEGASANIYRTVATFSPDTGGTIPVTEHGVFSQASNAGGVLLDRTVFSAVNVVAGADSIQSTYDLTFTAGS